MEGQISLSILIKTCSNREVASKKRPIKPLDHHKNDISLFFIKQ